MASNKSSLRFQWQILLYYLDHLTWVATTVLILLPPTEVTRQWLSIAPLKFLEELHHSKQRSMIKCLISRLLTINSSLLKLGQLPFTDTDTTASFIFYLGRWNKLYFPHSVRQVSQNNHPVKFFGDREVLSVDWLDCYIYMTRYQSWAVELFKKQRDQFEVPVTQMSSLEKSQDHSHQSFSSSSWVELHSSWQDHFWCQLAKLLAILISQKTKLERYKKQRNQLEVLTADFIFVHR